MIICPSCGSKVDCDLCSGCPSCGARAVGPPLAKAEHELASYGRAVIALAGGVVMSAGLLAATVAALVGNKGVWLGWSNILTAGEVAAWRLKWVALPLALIVLWGGARIIGNIKANPTRFIGLRAARLGFAASVLATLLIATLIGITVPVRLERRQWGIEAATRSPAYTLARAMLEYRELHGIIPHDSDKVATELRTLPDPDGSIADALRYYDSNGYQVGTVLAAASTKSKSLVPRGSAIRNASMIAAPATDHGVSFTSYELRLAGEDKIPNTDDDIIVRDGLVTKVSEMSPPPTSLSRPRTP